jgi:hypothetical protein
MAKSFKDLEVWKKSINLSKAIYELTESLLKISLKRRSLVSPTKSADARFLLLLILPKVAADTLTKNFYSFYL